MSSFGVIDTGFNTKTLQDLQTEVEQELRNAFGPAFNTQADSVAGQINAVFLDKLAEMWLVAQSVYRARQPDSASGEALDNVASITGAVRLPATPSIVVLSLNLDDVTTVPVGSIVRIGATGARWVSTAEATNATGAQTTVATPFESEDAAPVVGNAFAIDSIVTPIVGWSAKAAIESLNSEPFSLADLETFLLKVDEAAAQTVTFNTADFADITNATAQEVADSITGDITTGLTAVDANGKVRIVSDTDGIGSALEVTGGSGNPALGFSFEKLKGFNPDTSAKIISGNAELYDIDDADTLFLKVDQGGTQTATFNTGDFVDIDNATAIEIAAVINQDVTGALAYEVGGKVQIESLTEGTNSRIEITGGTSNTELGFTESEEQAGSSGDAELGRDIETDADFRLRRELLLRISGAATLEAIRAAVLDVTGVLQVFVFENTTDVTDGFGRPPHSFEVVASQGQAADLDIATTIFLTKPVGIETFKVAGPSGVEVPVLDSQGISRLIRYSKATEVQMHVEVDVSVTQAVYGGGSQVAGDQQVKEAIRDLGATLQIGEDVIINKFLCAPFGVAGVTDATAIKIEDIFPPTNTANIVIASRDVATFSTADIVVNVVFV